MSTSFVILDEFTGTEHGPYTLDQIRAQIYNKKLKKNVLVRMSDKKDFYKAEVLLGKVFQAIEQQKNEEKDKAKQEKHSRKTLQAKTLADRKEAKKVHDSTQLNVNTSKKKNVLQRKFSLFGTLKDSPYDGFKFMQILINILITLVIVWATLYSGFVLTVAVFLSASTQTSQNLNDMKAVEIEIFTADFTNEYLRSKNFDATEEEIQNALKPALEIFQEDKLPELIEALNETKAAVTTAWIMGILLAAGLALANLFASFLLVGFLVFCRNFIDWLIDMEHHQRAIRENS